MFNLKKALLSAAIGFSSFTNAQNCPSTGCNSTPFLTEDFSSPIFWNSVDNSDANGSFNFAQGRANFTRNDVNTFSSIQGMAGNRENRIFRTLPVTLSNTSFKAQFDFEIKGGNSPWHRLLSFTAGTQDPYATSSGCGNFPNTCSTWTLTNQDGINIDLFGPGGSTYSDRPITGNTWGIRVTTRKGTTDVHSATIPFNQANTRFYASFERVGGSNGVLSIFSDAALTTHIPGSPLCFAIDPAISGLNTMQIGTLSAGSYNRSAEGNVDNIKLYDCNVPPLTITATPTDSICPGKPVTLCATPGYVNYTWNPGNQTGNSIVVTPAVTTTYTVTARYPFSTSCTYTATITVKVKSVPTLNPDFSYTNTPSSTTYTVTATPLTSNATINSLGAGYGYAWTVKEVVDLNTGVEVPGTVMINPPNWMNNNSTNSFPGYCCNPTISTPAGVFSKAKKYWITRTVWGPCTDPLVYTAKCEFTNGIVSITPVMASVATSSDSPSIVAESNKAFSVFPNPTTQNLINVESGNIKGNKVIRVVNAEGKNVLEKTSNESSTQLDLNGLSYGLYLLSITSEDGNVVFSKFIKQ